VKEFQVRISIVALFDLAKKKFQENSKVERLVIH